MDLSVVVPTYRRPEPLAEAIRSALAQPVSLEMHVIDDGPGGEGEPVVASIGDPRVHYVRMDVPTGGNPSRVRNVGLGLARAPIVHFLDDDDRVLPGAYRVALDAFAAHPERGVVFGRVEPFGDDPVAVKRERAVFATSARRARILGRIGSRFLCAAHQLFANPTLLVNSACLVRRHVAERVGGYDEGIQVMEDVDFYTRAIRAAGFVFVDAPVIGYRTGHTSLMRAYDDRSVAPSFDRMYAAYKRRHGWLELRAAQLVAKAVLTHL